MSAVGVALFGSRSFGILLYAAHIASSIIVGILGKAYFAKKKRENEYVGFPTASGCREGCATAFTNAVQSSAESMLFLCAFVIFFSAVVGFLRFFAEQRGICDGLAALLIGFLEMTGGVASSAKLPLALALPLTAFITGWSGLSVHFQFISVCKGHLSSLAPYFISKLVCGVLNGAKIVNSISAGHYNHTRRVLTCCGLDFGFFNKRS